MGFLSSVVNGVFGLADTSLNAYYNKKAASQSNEYSWSMWNANNDYNSPKSQMQRLEEAGLNPNLVYGNGGATHQATMATAPKVSPAQSNLSQALVDYYTIKNMNEQNKALSMQNRKYAKDLKTYNETGVWPSDNNPFIQLFSNVSAKFFEHFGYKPEDLAAGAGAYLGDVFKAWMRANGGKH